MSDPAPQTESTSVKPAPATFAQKLGCGVMLVIAIVIGLVWWAMGDNAERWATSEVAAMRMSWPDQVSTLQGLNEPQRSEAARRLVDAWMLQPDESSEWRRVAKPSTKAKIRDLSVSMLLAQADKPAKQTRERDATKAASKAAAPKYTMFTPPPVDEHVARGGEVWARVAPADESVDGTGYRQFWLLSADRKTFVALVTVTPAEQSTPLASQHWFDTMPIGDGVSKPSGGSAGSFRFTPSLSTSAAALTITSDSTPSAPDGPLTTKTEYVTTFTFPDDPSVPAAVGEERTTVTVLKNGKPLADPKHVTKREQFHQIKKPNPPSAAGKGK